MIPADLTVKDIADSMRITVKTLEALVANPDLLFQKPRIQKVRTKARQIDAPYRLAKKRLRLLHNFLNEHFPPHRCVHGGAKGKSCFTAARKHLGRQVIIVRDIKDCYPSIGTAALYQSLLRYGFSQPVSQLLSKLFAPRNYIPQGSPVSADALNFHLQQLDEQVVSAASRFGGRYTRTYDDLVISTNNRHGIRPLSALLENALQTYSLSINHKKRSSSGNQFHNKEQRVHNLVVNSKEGIRIPKEQAQEALTRAAEYVYSAKCVTPESLEALAYKRARLMGWVYYCGQADFSPYQHLKRGMSQGDRHVQAKLVTVGLSCDGAWWVNSRRCGRCRSIAEAWRKRRDQKLSQVS